MVAPIFVISLVSSVESVLNDYNSQGYIAFGEKKTDLYTHFQLWNDKTTIVYAENTIFPQYLELCWYYCIFREQKSTSEYERLPGRS